jgi:hypothetical protein
MARAGSLRGWSRRFAACVAIWALALNIVIGPAGAFQPPVLDSFGQPICGHQAAGGDDQSQHPGAPDDALCGQCCCTAPALADVSPPLAPPLAVIWTRPAFAAGAEIVLPPPSRHPAGPPRGPPFA